MVGKVIQVSGQSMAILSSFFKEKKSIITPHSPLHIAVEAQGRMARYKSLNEKTSLVAN